ncbi:insulinase family protein [Janthinobacterium sp. J1-1]|uniref:insulinase family protein n=1 Tax=Janthinobacterium sp. J1-1 TaxID=3065910 RepID=UPI002811FC00|nr:insulinase family protein [Janthinobacterium sp. J1-1]
MSTFEKVSSNFIPVLQATIEQYVEPASGMRHIHMHTEQAEMVFLVAFPTVPEVSDGRAHILEHLALCGSARYPVRDPFFSMLRRSTATFMNAMTYPDRTVYPFASTDRKDFFNLLDVYLDAAFFPNLDYLNFRQEGWRHAFEGDKLVYQGIVFNEMKGAFNSPMRALDSGIASTLLKGTTYEVESGGDPLDIPELTHAMLKEFHASHYHPSQAVIMTAGNIEASAVQEQVAERVLSKLSGFSPRRLPQLAPAWTAPQENVVKIPSQEARDDEFGLQFAWLLGESSDPLAFYHAHLLSAGLLGESSAPVMRAMESAGYGRPSDMNGRDAGTRQMVFHIGMEGLTEEQIADAHARIWTALEETAEEGIPAAVLHAALRDIKYGQREISSGRMPYGLGRLLHALPLAMYDGDVMDAFDNAAILETLEQQIDDPEFFKQLVRELIANPTRLTTRVVPDAAFFTERAAQEDAKLAALQASLSDEQRAHIVAESAALDAHQQLPSNSEVLPRIRPGDVSAHPRPALAIPDAVNGAVAFSIASNGISYANVLYDVSHLPEASWPWLRLYTDLAPELGVGDMSFDDASAWRQSMVPSFHIGLEAIPRPQQTMRVELSFSASGLREEHEAIAAVLSAWIAKPRFDEEERLAFLIESLVQDKLSSLAESGSRYAMLASTAPLSPMRRFDDLIGGPAALPFYRRLQQLSKTSEGLQEIARELDALHAHIIAQPPTVLCAGLDQDGVILAGLLDLPRVDQTAAKAEVVEEGAVNAPPVVPLVLANTALHATSQINHCFVSWTVPGVHSPDASALAVAAELMTNQVLHTALREKGGAYGGSASYAAGAGTFTLSSYRDPRLAGTYADFDVTLTQILDGTFSQEQVEEAIICVIKGLDKPHSPYAEALTAWNMQQRGTTEAVRQQFRTGVLTCTLEQIKAVTRTWLKDGQPSRAAFAGNTTQDLAGLEVVDLLALAS